MRPYGSILVTVIFVFFSSVSYPDALSSTIQDENGNIFEVTIEAPIGKKVDARLLSDFGPRMTYQELDDSSFDQTSTPVNLSGYIFKIRQIQSATCRSVFQFRRKIPTMLDPGASFQVDGGYSEYLEGSFWPVSGNVNIFLYSNKKLCQKSAKPKNRLDSVGCYFPGCYNADYLLSLTVKNPSSSEEAIFVGSASVFYVNP